MTYHGPPRSASGNINKCEILMQLLNSSRNDVIYFGHDPDWKAWMLAQKVFAICALIVNEFQFKI